MTIKTRLSKNRHIERRKVNLPPHIMQPSSQMKASQRWLSNRAFHFYFFKNALNKSIGSGRNVVVLCSLAISRMVWR